MKKYNIGDTVWVANAGNKQITVPCPSCYGKKKVTLILGNDDHIILDCGYCSRGYETPSGTAIEYEYRADPISYKITGINIRIKNNGEEEIEYHSGTDNCYRNLSYDKVFSTKEEALMHCAEIIEQKQKEENTRAEYLKKDKNKSYSWNAGYHIREAKNHKKQMEYHESKAIICKSKSKEEIKE